MRHLHVCVVIPCLNEEDILYSTVTSLGFGMQMSIPSVTLILVDNGSTDRTIEVAKHLRDSSPTGAVEIGFEAVKGYVPPRHHGCILARDMARREGICESEILVLQADADTHYQPGYIEALRERSLQAGANVLVEGRIERPVTADAWAIHYGRLCDEIDSEFEEFLMDNAEDVIIDDKCCGYRLSDYFRWGGHRREFAMDGDEIHAETSRLYISAQADGAKRVRAEEAVANHSLRKAIACPSLDFGTAGFPREESWCRRWKEANSCELSLNQNVDAEANSRLDIAMELRRQHLLAIFFILPLHVAMTAHNKSALLKYPKAEAILEKLPLRGRHLLRRRPAVFLEDALAFVDPLF